MKRILALALAALLLLPALPVFAENTNGDGSLTNTDGFVYVLDESGSAEIVGYTGKEKKLVIPAKIDGHPVTAIGEKAFFSKDKLTGVTISEGVKAIKTLAFAGCDALKEVLLPEGLECLGDSAFRYCQKLKTINLPDSITRVDYGVFGGCEALKGAALSADHPYLMMVDGVLFSKPDHRLIWYPVPRKGGSYTVPEGTEIIDSYAFLEAKLTHVTVSESVKEIRKDAFSACRKLKSVDIPSQVSEMEGLFWLSEAVAQINVSPDNPFLESVDGVLFNKQEKTLIFYPRGRKGKTYTIPEGTRGIAEAAFSHSGLTEITIPGTVRKIGLNAFVSCKKLKKMVIPEGVEELDDLVFQDCASLTEVSLPYTLSVVNGNPFVGCGKLKQVQLPEDHPALALRDGALISTADQRLVWYSPAAKTTTYTVPQGVRIIGKWAFESCARLTELILPEGVEEVRELAFDSSGIKAFTLPASLMTIKKTAFAKKGGADTMIDATYTVPAGSYAEEFCRAYGLKTKTK